MNIHQLVNYLLDNGFTQEQLASQLTAKGVITRQATISRMAANPDYRSRSDKLLGLLDLYNSIESSKSKAIKA